MATMESTPLPEAQPSPSSPDTIFSPPSEIHLRKPILSSTPPPTNTTQPQSPNISAPPLTWLERTWTVSHSTLPMWRKAKNVRITYKILPPAVPGGPVRLDDCVESVPTQKTLLPQPKEVRGVDTLVVGGRLVSGEEEGWRWDWRGKGWLKIASSKWQFLGYGQRTVDGITENWAVTYFESSLFTPAGVDIYTDKREGMSEGLYTEIQKALVALGEGENGDGAVSKLCQEEMRRVAVDDA